MANLGKTDTVERAAPSFNTCNWISHVSCVLMKCIWLHRVSFSEWVLKDVCRWSNCGQMNELRCTNAFERVVTGVQECVRSHVPVYIWSHAQLECAWSHVPVTFSIVTISGGKWRRHSRGGGGGWSHSQVHDGVDDVVVALLEGLDRFALGTVGLLHDQLDIFSLHAAFIDLQNENIDDAKYFHPKD